MDKFRLVAPNVDVVVEAFDKGYDVGFNAALDGRDDARAEMFRELRYQVSCAYTDMIMDGVTQDSPVVHDVFEYLFDVLDGRRDTRDYANWGSDVR